MKKETGQENASDKCDGAVGDGENALYLDPLFFFFFLSPK